MDPRRLNTADVLAAGILDLPGSKIPSPSGREAIDICIDEVGGAHLISDLERGVVLNRIEYYGIARIWKEEDCYRGILLQYRSIAEDHTFDTAEKALDWFKATIESVTR